MKLDFRLRGLSNPKSGTLELLHTDKETFWASFEMQQERYKALFSWAKGEDDFWKTPWLAEVECDGLHEDGCPIKPIIVGIREWDLNYKPWDMPNYKN